MPTIRPCSATLFKRILVLENGVMAENGTRDELSRTSGAQRRQEIGSIFLISDVVLWGA